MPSKQGADYNICRTSWLIRQCVLGRTYRRHHAARFIQLVLWRRSGSRFLHLIFALVSDYELVGLLFVIGQPFLYQVFRDLIGGTCGQFDLVCSHTYTLPTGIECGVLHAATLCFTETRDLLPVRTPDWCKAHMTMVQSSSVAEYWKTAVESGVLLRVWRIDPGEFAMVNHLVLHGPHIHGFTTTFQKLTTDRYLTRPANFRSAPPSYCWCMHVLTGSTKYKHQLGLPPLAGFRSLHMHCFQSVFMTWETACAIEGVALMYGSSNGE